MEDSLKFNVMAAMCANRGIGLADGLPWPKLSKDYDYYMTQTGVPNINGKKNVNIYGRRTWETAGKEERSRPNVIFLVVSSQNREATLQDENITAVVPTLQDALEYVQHNLDPNIVETVWVMGGQKVYTEAVKHPCCKHVYLTHIEAHFSSDRFFPEFEHDYDLNRSKAPNPDIIEENGIKYQFKVYERNFFYENRSTP